MDYLLHIGVDFVCFEFVLLDVIIENTNTILDLLVGKISQLGSNFVEIGTYDTFSHADFKIFLNY